MTEKVIPLHRPDWPIALNQILSKADIVNQIGYITEFNTVKLLNTLHEETDIPKTAYSSEISGPTLILSAKSSLGFS